MSKQKESEAEVEKTIPKTRSENTKGTFKGTLQKKKYFAVDRRARLRTGMGRKIKR